MEEIQVTLEPQDNNRLSNLCGPLNDNIKILENLLDVKINQRGNLFHFIGKKESVEKASAMIKKLYIDSENSVITKDEISKILKKIIIMMTRKIRKITLIQILK